MYENIQAGKAALYCFLSMSTYVACHCLSDDLFPFVLICHYLSLASVYCRAVACYEYLQSYFRSLKDLMIAALGPFVFVST